MGGLLHLVQRRGDWAMLQPTHQQSVYQSMLYNGPLFCGFDVPIKALDERSTVMFRLNCFTSLIEVARDSGLAVTRLSVCEVQRIESYRIDSCVCGESHYREHGLHTFIAFD